MGKRIGIIQGIQRQESIKKRLLTVSKITGNINMHKILLDHTLGRKTFLSINI